MSFDTLGLLDQITSAIEGCGYTTPTQIQKEAIPLILQGKDILGGAQTGTGKTASFMLPLLQLVKERKDENEKSKLTALILVPTRELAAQVHDAIHTYGKYLYLRSTVVFGGVNIKAQKIKLRKGVDILVSTPGRLLDHVSQRSVDLSSVNTLVLDEADCMLDMGFIHDIRKILGLLPTSRQTLLFSATFSDQIKQLAKDFLKNPEMVQVAQKNTVSEQVKHLAYPVDRERKHELLLQLMETNDWKQVLVFTRTKHAANKLSEKLDKEGIPSAAIHGNKTQAARMKALSSFKRGDVRVLVATDIAARGINISQLPAVINFELPTVPSDYIHRIGRTGRAGNEGEAISLVCVDEHGLIRDIERLLKSEIPQIIVPGFEVDPSIKPQPIRRGKGNKGSGQNQRGFRNERSSGRRRPEQRSDSRNKRDSSRGERPFKKERPASEQRSDSRNKRDASRSERPFRKERPASEQRSDSRNKRDASRSERPFRKERPAFEQKSDSRNKRDSSRSERPFRKERPASSQKTQAPKRKGSADERNFRRERPAGNRKPDQASSGPRSKKPSTDKKRAQPVNFVPKAKPGQKKMSSRGQLKYPFQKPRKGPGKKKPTGGSLAAFKGRNSRPQRKQK